MDPDTLLEWISSGHGEDNSVQLVALEQLCMTLLMSDNVDRSFERYVRRLDFHLGLLPYLVSLLTLFLFSFAQLPAPRLPARALSDLPGPDRHAPGPRGDRARTHVLPGREHRVHAPHCGRRGRRGRDRLAHLAARRDRGVRACAHRRAQREGPRRAVCQGMPLPIIVFCGL